MPSGRFELPISGFGGQHSVQLNYEGNRSHNTARGVNYKRKFHQATGGISSPLLIPRDKVVPLKIIYEKIARETNLSKPREIGRGGEFVVRQTPLLET